MRELNELINNEDPGWAILQDWVKDATNQNEILPATDPQRAEALLATQVTTRSIMGAIIYESGGILIDHGWLRILGSGHPKLLRSLPEWNRTVGIDFAAGAPFILIADDAVGGFFALDGGGLGNAGKVFYFAPDSLEWEDTENSYSEFIQWCLVGIWTNSTQLAAGPIGRPKSLTYAAIRGFRFTRSSGQLVRQWSLEAEDRFH